MRLGSDPRLLAEVGDLVFRDIIITMNLQNSMTNLALNNFFFILGIVFLMIAVLGQTKLGFAEINPGCFGRVLALFLGILSLVGAVFFVNPPWETLDLLRNYLTQKIQQNIGLFTELLNS